VRSDRLSVTDIDVVWQFDLLRFVPLAQ